MTQSRPVYLKLRDQIAASILEENDGLVEVQRGVGMYVVNGAAQKLRQREREQFLNDEWPEIRAKIGRLGIHRAQLFEGA